VRDHNIEDILAPQSISVVGNDNVGTFKPDQVFQIFPLLVIASEKDRREL
jgi:hypothetical protein